MDIAEEVLTNYPQEGRDYIGAYMLAEPGPETIGRLRDGHAAGHAPRPPTDHPAGFRAQCPANTATTGASVSAEPAPKTK